MSNPTNGAIGGFWLTSGVGAGSAKILPYMAIATVNVADPAGLTDGFGAALSVDASGRLRVILGGPAPAGTVGTVVGTPAQANSPGNAARVTAPAAGQAIATIAAGSLPAGTYDVQVQAQFDLGAPAAADTNNMEFRRGATVVSSLDVLPVINVYSPVAIFRCVLDGATALSINATAAGTAGVGYNASLIAVRVA